MASAPQPRISPLEADSPGARARAVREMFSAIAPRYDLLNHLLSLNLDRVWRRRAVDRLGWESRPDGLYLDLCAGTFDLALTLTRRAGFPGRVIAIDFALPMLRRGLAKITRHSVTPISADALHLPLASASVDGAMIAFGIRNLVDIDAGLRELRRVLRDGSRLVILDFTSPARQPFKQLYRFYFTRALPFVGRLISKHSFAYSYLPESVDAFATPAQLGAKLAAARYGDVGWQSMTGGVTCVWWGAASAAEAETVVAKETAGG